MTVHANQLSALADALAAVLPLGEPADIALHTFFRGRARMGARDRAFVADGVFATLRRLRSLTRHAGTSTPRGLAIAAVVRELGVSLRDLEPAFSEEELAWAKDLKARKADLSPAEAADLPDWLWDKLGAALSASERDALARAWLSPAPLDLRVNTFKMTRDGARAALAAQGIESQPTPLSPIGLRVTGKPSLQDQPVFADGGVEVQDEGSQLLGYLVAPRRSDMVVDFCAGAGGKTLMLGALMRSQGRLYAFDVSPQRLARLKPRLARSGLSNVQPTLIEHERDVKIKRLAGKIDRVLVDAPCSGFGTLRRNPDLKWRQSQASIDRLVSIQARILVAAGGLLKPGGRLVYATCSVLPEENEAIVEGFLAAHPGYALRDATGELGRAGIVADGGPYLRLYPHRHGCDGFFAAVMERA
jgi:16S rRNA (cytosine967-C5)-methyltransferase